MSVGLTTALVIGGIAAAGGSVASAAIGAHAAGKAADVQKNAADEAAAREQPWVDAGGKSLGELMKGFDDGTYGPNSIPGFQAPTVAEAEQTPGYQFTRDQGNRGVLAGASRSGNSLSGAALKELDQYNTGLADSTYNDTFNRALSTYQAKLQGQQQSFNQLFNVSNQGQNAATNVGNLMTQGANAQAAGIVGQANAIGGGIQGATGDISQTLLLNKLLAGGFGTGGSTPSFPTPGSAEGAGALSVPPLPENIGAMAGFGVG